MGCGVGVGNEYEYMDSDLATVSPSQPEELA